MEFLEREVKKGSLVNGRFQVEDVKKVHEIIDEGKDIFELDGKPILKHTGIEKLAGYVGAYWEEPRKEDTPTASNARGFYYLCKCVFPDGSYRVASGEASDENTNSKDRDISYRYKQSMAIKRGEARSFLRSPYMGFFDVMSEEESWEIKKNEQEQKAAKTQEALRKAEAALKIMEEKEAKFKAMIRNMRDRIALDAYDPQYPGEYIVDVWETHGDKEYLGVLAESEDSINKWVAASKLKEIEKAQIPEETGDPEVQVEDMMPTGLGENKK